MYYCGSISRQSAQIGDVGKCDFDNRSCSNITWCVDSKFAARRFLVLRSIRMESMIECPRHEAVTQPVRVLTPVLCPLGFVHGYRCGACSWAVLFPDCHVQWSVPFCYQMHAKSAFEGHRCHALAGAGQEPSCRLCHDLWQSTVGSKQ